MKKKSYTSVLHEYGKNNNTPPCHKPTLREVNVYKPPEKTPRLDAITPKPQQDQEFNENVDPNNCIVPMYPEDTNSYSSRDVTP